MPFIGGQWAAVTFTNYLTSQLARGITTDTVGICRAPICYCCKCGLLAENSLEQGIACSPNTVYYCAVTQRKVKVCGQVLVFSQQHNPTLGSKVCRSFHDRTSFMSLSLKERNSV